MEKMKIVPTTILFLGLVLLGGLRRGGAKSLLPAQNELPAILVGAGDIADCRDLAGAEATAKLLEKIPGTVMLSLIHI